jgi:orotate phosphoribosyltransferase
MTHFSADKINKLRQLLQEYSVRTGTFTLVSGKTSDFYVDCKQTALQAEGCLLIGELIFEHIQALRSRGETIVGVGGITLGADPMAAATAVVSQQKGDPAHAFIVRKEPKGPGTGRWVEGMKALKIGDPVLVIEDVVTTGGSTLRAIERVREAGLIPIAVLALVDREETYRNTETFPMPRVMNATSTKME